MKPALLALVNFAALYAVARLPYSDVSSRALAWLAAHLIFVSCTAAALYFHGVHSPQYRSAFYVLHGALLFFTALLACDWNAIHPAPIAWLAATGAIAPAILFPLVIREHAALSSPAVPLAAILLPLSMAAILIASGLAALLSCAAPLPWFDSALRGAAGLFWLLSGAFALCLLSAQGRLTAGAGYSRHSHAARAAIAFWRQLNDWLPWCIAILCLSALLAAALFRQRELSRQPVPVAQASSLCPIPCDEAPK